MTHSGCSLLMRKEGSYQKKTLELVHGHPKNLMELDVDVQDVQPRQEMLEHIVTKDWQWQSENQPGIGKNEILIMKI